MTLPMRHLAGGRFRMGSANFYPEERPVRTVTVAPFWIDETPVTNAAFAAFVTATGHVTVAELPPDPALYPDLPPERTVPGSAVFRKTAGPVDLGDPLQWWDFVAGANWRQPLGPGSSIADMDDHPVIQVAHADAAAYAAWAEKDLPTEAEWEFAARGGRDGADYAWGDALAPDGAMLANYWQGLFPFANQLLDGWERTSPVRSFPANDYGIYDMIGNVWEWTADDYRVRQVAPRKCCAPGRREARAVRANEIASKVLKGGSHLCAANYCQRYRPAARHPETIDTATSHIGFRCVRR